MIVLFLQISESHKIFSGGYKREVSSGRTQLSNCSAITVIGLCFSHITFHTSNCCIEFGPAPIYENSKGYMMRS